MGRLSTGGRPGQDFGQGDESDKSNFSRLEPGWIWLVLGTGLWFP